MLQFRHGGDWFCSARRTLTSCKCEFSYSSDVNTGGGGCSDKVASSVASILDIKKKVLDLEGKNSDICHVINYISHFPWIMYIEYCHGEL